jgi:hypothetical protein
MLCHVNRDNYTTVFADCSVDCGQDVTAVCADGNAECLCCFRAD